ncbi:hypothetical protein BDZ91DRAFT_497493 [Kalaharituber pfeilii]|nr:hypothetical protein BDZ91DRAFT_497493 [Kalaharituber pfeilii]
MRKFEVLLLQEDRSIPKGDNTNLLRPYIPLQRNFRSRTMFGNAMLEKKCYHSILVFCDKRWKFNLGPHLIKSIHYTTYQIPRKGAPQKLLEDVNVSHSRFQYVSLDCLVLMMALFTVCALHIILAIVSLGVLPGYR